ncbi:spindle pole body-associated sad1 [Fusarium subglutinans]|uniref:Spindle pole body-associated sad1 n=1 Tax=Gibberella subglutinans TaxID=42677 RepID=A0A8H5Q879_GIBSU|nr:spindle pole body-associated sad1 [Fusarium subglutinans]KAF5610449.1 spindle pole body-associated sad1 [Fusarium subglutinans]
MPPRVSRRSTRLTSREPEQQPTNEPPNTLVRPHLPALQGTPSTRRQYTYGSAAEPPPKVGAGLQRMDLGSAVNQALANNVDEEEEFVQPAKPRAAPARADDAGPSRDNTSRSATGTAQQLAIGRDDDSSRSFGLESEYYEDAMIGLVPPLTASIERQLAAPNLNPRAQRDTSVQRSLQPSRLSEQHSLETQPSRPRLTQQRPLQVPRQTRQQSSEPDEDEPENRAAPTARSRTSANTPAPNKTRQSQPRPRNYPVEDSEQSESSAESDQDDIESDIKYGGNARKARTVTKKTSTRTVANPSRRQTAQQLSRHAAPERRDQRTSGGQSLFSGIGRTVSQSSAFEQARQIPHDPQERVSDIQREIQEAEDQIARERAERAERERAPQIEPWRQWYREQIAWLSTLWPFNLIWRRRGDDDFDDFDDDQYNDGGPTDWRKLLNPMTYLQSVVWLVDKIMDHFVNLLDRLSGVQIRGSQIEAVVYTVLMVCVSLLLGVFLYSGMGAVKPSLPSIPNFGLGDFHIPNPSGFVHNVGDMIPSFSMPSMPSWPSWSRGDDEHDVFAETPINNIQLTDEVKKAVKKLTSKLSDQKKSLEKLEAKLPQFITMETVNGKPSIPQQFYHGLQDYLKESGSFLNMKKKGGNYEISTEKQWKAIVAGLGKDRDFQSKLKKVVDSGIEEKLPTFWDKWFKNNNKILEPLVEKAMAKTKAAGSGAAFDKKVAQIVNEQLGKQNQTVVTRNEFIKHLGNELATHQTTVQAELQDLKSDMLTHIQESIRTAQLMAPQGTSDAEMRKLIREIVVQTISDEVLGVGAKAKIHEDWNTRLKHQVNFFAVGAGATIDDSLTTGVWDPWKKGVATKEALKRGISGLHPLPAAAALLPWQDEGDCFCSVHDIDGSGRYHGARISVHLGHLVVPTDIVIEHINKNATTDPLARPRQIEVFARFEDEMERDQVFAITSNWFRDDTINRNVSVPLSDQFVKISDFEYVGNELNDGVHVQHIKDQFSNLGIGTDQIVVRSMGNYGAVDHTCFYRIRLFGNVVE